MTLVLSLSLVTRFTSPMSRPTVGDLWTIITILIDRFADIQYKNHVYITIGRPDTDNASRRKYHHLYSDKIHETSDYLSEKSRMVRSEK